jgi:hypothetical protein
MFTNSGSESLAGKMLWFGCLGMGSFFFLGGGGYGCMALITGERLG